MVLGWRQHWWQVTLRKFSTKNKKKKSKVWHSYWELNLVCGLQLFIEVFLTHLLQTRSIRQQQDPSPVTKMKPRWEWKSAATLTEWSRSNAVLKIKKFFKNHKMKQSTKTATPVCTCEVSISPWLQTIWSYIYLFVYIKIFKVDDFSDWCSR